MALPVDSKAEPREIVVIVRLPLCVVVKASSRRMLRLRVICREAVRSIFRFFTGSRVARICTFSVLLVVAGVEMESLFNSQPLS